MVQNVMGRGCWLKETRVKARNTSNKNLGMGRISRDSNKFEILMEENNQEIEALKDIRIGSENIMAAINVGTGKKNNG